MTQKHPYRSQFPGVGPKTVEDLEFMGIHTREELAVLGAEGAMELFLRLHGGWQYGMCSCVAYGFEGIITKTLRYKIPDARKKQLVAATHALRKKGDDRIAHTIDAPVFTAAVPLHDEIIDALSSLFCSLPDVREEMRSYGPKRYFANGMRCDLLCRGQQYPILRVSRGARMIRQEPYLAGLFDVNARVISKIIIRDTQTITDKALPQLISKIANLPDGIGVLQ